MKKLTLIAALLIGMIYSCTREANLLPKNKGYVPLKGVQGNPSAKQTTRKYCMGCVQTIIPSYCVYHEEITGVRDANGESITIPAWTECKNNFFINATWPSMIHKIDSIAPASDPIHSQLDTAGARLFVDSFIIQSELCKYTEFSQRLAQIGVQSGLISSNLSAFENLYTTYKERQDSILYGSPSYIPVTTAFKAQWEAGIALFRPLETNPAYNSNPNYIDLKLMLDMVQADLNLNVGKTTAQIKTYYGY